MHWVKTEQESLGMLESTWNPCTGLKLRVVLVAIIGVLEKTRCFSRCNTQTHRDTLFLLPRECSGTLLLHSHRCFCLWDVCSYRPNNLTLARVIHDSFYLSETPYKVYSKSIFVILFIYYLNIYKANLFFSVCSHAISNWCFLCALRWGLTKTR